MSDVSRFLDWFVAATSAGLLMVIVISWLLSYRTPETGTLDSSKWFALPRWAQIVTGLITIVLFVYLGFRFWIPLPFSVPADGLKIIRLAGLAIFLLGALLVLWARWTLGRMYGVSTSSAVRLKAGPQLVQHGPYALVRHPMYLGIWLLLLGPTLVYRTWALLILFLLLLALYRRAKREEEVLEAAFGEAWRSYAARVPMFLPRWRRRVTMTRAGQRRH